MSQRRFWTIYDDDTRDWDGTPEEIREYQRISEPQNIRIEFILNRKSKVKEKTKKSDHFEEEKDLFEV